MVWPNLVLAKLGLAKLGVGQTWSGQTWIWPNLVWPNLDLAKLGLAKLGHSRRTLWGVAAEPCPDNLPNSTSKQVGQATQGQRQTGQVPIHNAGVNPQKLTETFFFLQYHPSTLQIWQSGDLRDQLVVCRRQRLQLGADVIWVPPRIRTPWSSLGETVSPLHTMASGSVILATASITSMPVGTTPPLFQTCVFPW